MSSKQHVVPPPLTAQDKSSFAYKTIKERLPVIVVKTIDFFHRKRKDLNKFGGVTGFENAEQPSKKELEEMEQDAKDVITALTKLRKDLETNKAVHLLEPVAVPDEYQFFNNDIDLWNQALGKHRFPDQTLPRWFDSPWLLVECYLYRKIKDAMLRTKHLRVFDAFVEQKQLATESSSPQMAIVAAHLIKVEKAILGTDNNTHPSERSEFSLFMQLSLWANKCDLSISGGSADDIQANKLLSDIRESLESLQANILCDNLSEVWFKIQDIKGQIENKKKEDAAAAADDYPCGFCKQHIYIDLVADNSGYELFADLCLIHFLSLIFCGGREDIGVRFRIHVKRMSWFVSDALQKDVDKLLEFLMKPDQNESLQALGKTWKSFIDKKLWEVHDHRFWTLPNDYSEMKLVSPDLHKQLESSKLIIFKGDLNYRKLTGDRKWHLLTPFRVALRGFQPAPLVALRTAKADVLAGIEDINIFARINNNELPRDWMISGEYGVIQYVEPI